MEPISAIAIYLLFWVMTAFIVLPIGIRNHFETETEMVKGQADGAPVNFRPLRVILLTTLFSAIAFGLFYLNFIYGWITVDDIDFFGARERL